ncbi:MAG: M42 family metallopeptidase [Ruminococcaceae bacterium]|nr:M42 family metallopeptidase [Oscillospiraceae bacterium]
MTLKDKIMTLGNMYGVSGDEFRVAEAAAELLKPYVDKVEIDKFGNVSGYKFCGKPGAKVLMLDAHIDEIGFMVTGITDEGFLRFVGMGVDQRMLPGSRLNVMTKTGNILGIVGAIPPHLQNPGDNTKSLPIDKLYVDIGMSAEEARKKVRIGDYMTFTSTAFDLLGDQICGKSFDDRACFCCLLHALELLQGKELNCDLIIIGTTKEEVGGHGASYRTYVDKPDLAVAIDVCHARTDDNKPGDRVHELGGGPVIAVGTNSRPRFARRVMEIARAKDIPYQVAANPSRTGTNAWSMQIIEEGCVTLVVSLPLKYMHSPVEVIKMSDVENVGRLLAELALDIDGRWQL